VKGLSWFSALFIPNIFFSKLCFLWETPQTQMLMISGDHCLKSTGNFFVVGVNLCPERYHQEWQTKKRYIIIGLFTHTKLLLLLLFHFHFHFFSNKKLKKCVLDMIFFTEKKYIKITTIFLYIKIRTTIYNNHLNILYS